MKNTSQFCPVTGSRLQGQGGCDSATCWTVDVLQAELIPVHIY